MVCMKDVNIIIVNYKMKDDIEKCLVSLFAGIKASGLDVQVTVVDNASGDGVEGMLKEKYVGANGRSPVQFIMNQKNIGFGKAQNVGMQSCTAKYYFALNPDTEFLPGTGIIKKLFDFMEEHPKIGIIGPKIVYPDGSLQSSCYRFPSFWQPIFSRTKLGQRKWGKKINEHFLMKDFNHNKTQPVDWIMGSAMFIRNEAIKQVGMFDDRYWMYAEDSDWCRRMWDAGWPVYYVHDIVIQHAHGRGSAKIPGVFKALIKNKLARVHLLSWLKYMWKWRGTGKYYKSKKL